MKKEKQTKHPGHVFVPSSSWSWSLSWSWPHVALTACSESPFATPSATRIGYVECPFNGLYTLTLGVESHPFTNLLEGALVFRAVWLPWIAAAWFSSFFCQFLPLLLPQSSQTRHNFTLCVLPGNYGTLSELEATEQQMTSWKRKSWPADKFFAVIRRI